MSLSLSFIRLLFLLLCIFFSISFITQAFEGGANLINFTLGLIGGLVLSGVLMILDVAFKRFNLKSFNTAILGLFFGYLMSEVIMLILGGIIGKEALHLNLASVKFFILMTCSYFGMVMTLRSSEELSLSIPFVQFKEMNHKKKDILIDGSVLVDSRIIDLTASGLLDHHLILPRFIVKELYALSETGDEIVKTKARRSLEIVKKLEGMPLLEMRYIDTDFPEIKDPMSKLIRLARFCDSHILTSDMSRVQQSSIEGIRIINLNLLSNALKPLTQSGEFLNIKIQRYGKEPRQGVGYLEDGTMVVVNGGAEFIGESIRAQVLSVKHTSSGRMIFCNASEDGSLMSEQDFHPSLADLENASKSYLTL